MFTRVHYNLRICQNMQVISKIVKMLGPYHTDILYHDDLMNKKNSLHIRDRTSTSGPLNIFIWLFRKIVSPRLWSYKRKYNIYGHEAAQFINIASLCPVSHKSAGRWNRFKVVIGCCSVCMFSFYIIYKRSFTFAST